MVSFPFARSQRSSTVPAEAADGFDTSAAAHVGQPEKLSLWERLTTVRINPVNNKCTTLPILKLNNPYSINFHLYAYLMLPLRRSLTQLCADRGSVSGWLCESRVHGLIVTLISDRHVMAASPGSRSRPSFQRR